MGRYREYKNGIYGARYKGYYIETQKAKTKTSFTVVGEEGDRGPSFSSFGEAQWYLDLLTADQAEKDLVKRLYAQDIFVLSSLLVDFNNKKEDVTAEEALAAGWLRKVRSRKMDGLPEEAVPLEKES